MAWEDDILAAARGEADQTEAGMAEFGRFVYGYYKSLLEAGFTKAQAFNLAAQYQSVMIGVALHGKGRQ